MPGTVPQNEDAQRTQREREALLQREKAGQITQALSEGKLPSTDQVTTAISELQDAEIIHDTARGMSPTGKKVLADTEKLLETTKKVLEEKNANEELQNVIYYGTCAAKDIGETAIPSKMPQDLKQKARGEATNAQTLVRKGIDETANIVRLLISSSEFRKLVNDIHTIVQEAIARGVPQNQQTSRQPAQQPKNIGAGVGSDKEKSVKQAVRLTGVQARESVEPVAKSVADISHQYLKDYSEGRLSFQEAAKHGARALASEFQDSSTDYKLSPESRDKLVNRFKNLMLEVQKNSEYQEALSGLVNIAKQLSQNAQKITIKASGQAAEATEHPALEKVEKNAKELLENFASHRSLDPLISALNELASKIKADNELHQYFTELQNFVLKSLREPEFVQKTDYISLGSRQIERGRTLLLDNYGHITQGIVDEISHFNRGLQEDSTTTQLSNDIETLTKDLFLDEKGRPTIKLELVKDFAKILPLVGEKVKFIALPRIEGEDEEYEYIFDNIVLHVPEIVPKHVHMNLAADINLDRPEEKILQNTITLDITKMKADARNIAFFYKKKKGLVNFMDVGFLDFAIPEEKGGLNVHVKILLNMPTERVPLTFTVLENHTKISDLSLRFRDTKHDFLYKLLLPLVESRIKNQLESLINNNLKEAVDYVERNISKAQSKISELNRQQGDNGHQVGHERLKQKEPWNSAAFNSGDNSTSHK